MNADQVCEALQLQEPTDDMVIIVQDLVLGTTVCRCSPRTDFLLDAGQG